MRRGRKKARRVEWRVRIGNAVHYQSGGTIHVSRGEQMRDYGTWEWTTYRLVKVTPRRGAKKGRAK